MQERVVHCKGVEYGRSGRWDSARGGNRQEVWNMQEESDIARDVNMQQEVGHCGRRGTCRKGWTYARGVEYSVGEVGHCERCEIYITRGEEHCERCCIARDVNMQEEVGHCERC
jgi:hypothetical protein